MKTITDVNELIQIWKNIEGFENLYQICDLGRVKSLERSRKGRNNSKVLMKEKILKNNLQNTEYLTVTLSKNNKLKTL
jgi:hypothetical protein